MINSPRLEILWSIYKGISNNDVITLPDTTTETDTHQNGLYGIVCGGVYTVQSQGLM